MPEPAQELNLTPIMNLVVLLIPLLLLSVVFEQAGVLPVSPPVLTTTPTPGEPPFSLRVTLSADGFRVDAAQHVAVQASGTCPQSIALTICNQDTGQVTELVRQALRERRSFDQTGDRAALKRSDEHISRARAQYDFGLLVQTLEAIKREHPDQQRATLAADPNLPYELVVATMEAMRGQPDKNQGLFQDVVLGVIQ
jgi:biopolymer transport protein ExbD